MAMLRLRDSRDSDVRPFLRRLRRFQRAHGKKQVAKRTFKKLERAASEGLIFICEDGRNWIGACGVMFEHSHAIKNGRKRPVVVLHFIEAGGGAVHDHYQNVGVVTLLLYIGTLAAMAKDDSKDSTYFIVASPKKPCLGPYKRMPPARSQYAIAAARYAKDSGIIIGKTHRYFEFRPDAVDKTYGITNREIVRITAQGVIADFKNGKTCPLTGRLIDVDFSDVESQFPRWGV